ncbi:alpha/beta hydrolase [Hamadaea tsunoensis]|uniref:alpha/beta hydrolase n=1 Tax=Hamadaea tsunoensis TaxID=53368 RepID=UPI00040C9F89
MSAPALEGVRRTGSRAVIIVAHGGQADSRAPAGRGRLTYLWQWGFSRALVPLAREYDAQVWRLRYRFRGWNGAAADAARDATWAVRRFGGRPVLLVGHSMGGRAVLYAAAAVPGVAGVCALAPWIEPGDPLVRTPALILHGSRDRITDPAASRAYADRSGARFALVEGDGHFMVRHPQRWFDPTAEFLRERLREITG